MSEASVLLEAIHLYPVKSCRGIEVGEVEVADTGLAEDRRWQIVDESRAPVTQRTHPELARIQPRLGPALTLAAEGHGSVVADPRPAGEPATTLAGVPVPVLDGGDEVATWLSDLLGVPARLVGLIEGARLPEAIDMWGRPLAFGDAAPVLVCNQASVDWLVERSAEPFAKDRFRPNLTLSGAEPWDEDTWARCTLGSVELSMGPPWPRCAIPQIDQLSGERHREPARVLRRHRWCSTAPGLAEAIRPIVEGNALFGVAAAVSPVGETLRRGDRLTLIEVRPPLIPAPG